MQLHPGDLGWFWQFGAQATAAAVSGSMLQPGSGVEELVDVELRNELKIHAVRHRTSVQEVLIETVSQVTSMEWADGQRGPVGAENAIHAREQDFDAMDLMRRASGDDSLVPLPGVLSRPPADPADLSQ